MNTEFALLARFNTTDIPLKDICQEYLGITPKTAETKAKDQELPFSTYKLRDSQKAPTFVRAKDLAEHIDNQYEESKKVWKEVNLQTQQ